MIIVLAAMISGMILGFLLKGRKWLLPLVEPLSSWVIRLLLFLLGFGIGRDRELLARVPELGFSGLILSLAAIAGSVLVARLLVGRKNLIANDSQPSGKYSRTKSRAWWSVLHSMRGSLFAVVAFGIGLPAGYLAPPFKPLAFDAASATLYILMFLVGIGAGSDPTAFGILKKNGLRMMLLPLAVIAGSLGGAALLAFALPALPIRESLAVAAGFGYYSLSSLIISEISGGDWAAVALLSNISREIITLLTAPLLARLFGPAAPAASGAATSMDTTLAAAIQASGRSWTVPALFSGVVLTLLTPVAVTVILTV